MNSFGVNKILTDTAYVRLAGTENEKKCAEYIVSLAKKMGCEPIVESFSITDFVTLKAKLLVDKREVKCTAYKGSPSGIVGGKIYYLNSLDKTSFKKCKDKIVLLDKPINFDLYNSLVQNGAIAVITYNGNINLNNTDIDTRSIAFKFPKEKMIPCLNIHISDALQIIKKNLQSVEIIVDQEEIISESQNVIVDIKGKTDETVIVSAHYDTTALSVGAYDNMSSCIALLYMLEYFKHKTPYYTIRFLWCGSEEAGLLGSLEYCKKHETELNKTILNVNLDMLGSIMGEFNAFSCIDEKMQEFLEKFLRKHQFSGIVKYGIRSSDSNSFLLFGVPAVSFARYAPSNIGSIHTRYDTKEMLSAKQILKDTKLITAFCEDIANTPSGMENFKISEKIIADTENYFKRKSNPVWLFERCEKNEK